MKKFLITLLIIGILFTTTGFIIVRCNSSEIDNVFTSSCNLNLGSFFNSLFNFASNKDNYINNGCNFLSSDQIDCKYEKKEKCYKNISKIDINVNAYNVYILNDSKDDKINLEINMPIIEEENDKHLFDISLDDNTDYIKIDKNTKYRATNGFNYTKYQKVKKNCYVKIHLPKDYCLENTISSTEIRNSMCNIKIDSLNTNSLKVNASMGNIEAYNIISNSQTNINASMGNIVSKNIKSKKLEINNSMGNINLNDISVDDSIMLDTSMGNVNIYNIIAGKDIDINSSMGTIDAKNIDAKDINLDCSQGSVSITLNDFEDNYNFDLDASMGKIKINDNSFKKSAQINNGADKSVKINSSMGTMTIITK